MTKYRVHTDKAKLPVQPEGDVQVSNHGSLYIVTPLTTAAEIWIDEHVDPEAQRWGGGIVVEPRYVDGLIAGMRGDGLEVGH